MAMRRSTRKIPGGIPKDDMIIIIQTPEGGGRGKQITDVKTSIIQHMCNKCNKKYTTTLGLKRHLKFCNDSTGDISLQMPADNNYSIGKITENHNDVTSKNRNLVANVDSSDRSRSKSKNPYIFDEDNNLSEAEDSSEEKNPGNPKLCECCGEDIETAHKAGEFKCTSCVRYYKHQESLDHHNLMFHACGPDAIPCKQCPVSCANEKVMFQHMQMHTPSRSFKCHNCDKTFTRKYHLDRHLVQTGCGGHEKASYPCQVCGYVFTRKDNLREHLRNHIGKSIAKKVYGCDVCNREFKGKTMLTVHLRSHTGETPFKCDTCPKAFKSKGGLSKHERCHTGQRPYSCSLCEKTFTAKETLNRHSKTHWEDKPHVCNTCGKSFIQASQLRAHMFYHNGENGFQCKYCNLTFNRKLRLTTHEQFVHEGAKKLPCPFEGCDKTFMRREDMKRHLTVHSELKPHVCKICTKRFRTTTLIKAHFRTHRREEARSCTRCPRAFIRADCLLRHMRSRHPDQYQEMLREARRVKLENMKARLKARNMGASNRLIETDGHDMSSEENDDPDMQLLQMASQSSDDIEVEVVDIPLTEDYLAQSIQELLNMLIDKESVENFNWSGLGVDEVLEGVIEKCGHTPAKIGSMDRPARLRENAKLLLTVVIDDSTTKKLFETQTVDEVILHVLQLGKCN